MVSISILIYGFILISVTFLGVLLFYFKDEIRAFVWPNRWVDISMIESDNNVSQWLQKKSEDLRFDFNDGKYNLFEASGEKEVWTEREVPKPDGTKSVQKVKKFVPDGKYSVVYRSGRLAKFFYIEGNENPLDMRELKPSGNPRVTSNLMGIDLSKLFRSETTMMEDLWKRFGPFVMIGGIGLIIFILLQGGGA